MARRADATVEYATARSRQDEKQRQAQRETNHALIDLLRSWREEEDPEAILDQQQTGEILVQALGADRESYRKLFP